MAQLQESAPDVQPGSIQSGCCSCWTGKELPCLLTIIISGGQTGVDRAALDAAAERGLQRGGWCPKGRLAEDGVLPDRYPLQETPLADYGQRTEWNVRDSDATLILARGEPTGGTAFTLEMARRWKRPFLVVSVKEPDALGKISRWLREIHPAVLNVAGPRESSAPGIYAEVKDLLCGIL